MLSRILINGMTLAKSSIRTLRRKGARDAEEIPDASLYRPVFSPWLGSGDFADVIKRISPYSLVSADRLWVLLSLARQARWVAGDFWECGVYKGGTAMLLERIVADAPGKRIHLFDTFAGMPDTDPDRDLHRRGDFGDTSLDAVRRRVGLGSTSATIRG